MFHGSQPRRAKKFSLNDLQAYARSHTVRKSEPKILFGQKSLRENRDYASTALRAIVQQSDGGNINIYQYATLVLWIPWRTMLSMGRSVLLRDVGPSHEGYRIMTDSITHGQSYHLSVVCVAHG